MEPKTSRKRSRPSSPFPPDLAEDDFPSIGARRRGWTFVCVGEDRPDQWIGWLDGLVCEAEELLVVAERVDTDLGFHDWLSFCEAIGVTIESQRMGRDLACGIGYLGWVRSGTRREILRKAGEVLGQAKARLGKRLLEPRVEED